jgi:LysM repeat protein
MNRLTTRAARRALGMIGIVSALLITGLASRAGVQLVGAQDSTHTVAFGDTFETIARRYDVALTALLNANDLTVSSVIFPGTVLSIPQNAPPFGYTSPMGTDVTLAQARRSSPTERLYVVQPRDVLDLIAVYYNVQLTCLVEANAISNPARVAPGAILLIPNDCPAYDGLSSIGVTRGYEIGSERALRPPTRAAGQSDVIAAVPGSS